LVFIYYIYKSITNKRHHQSSVSQLIIMSNFLWANHHKGSFGSTGSNKATDSDGEADDFLDSDDGEEAGLEMENLLLAQQQTPNRGRRTTQRSDSGSNILLRRSNTPSSGAASSPSAPPAGGPCDSGSRKIARAGRFAARRVFSRNRRVSVWLFVMLLMVIASVSLNAFEGTYISNIFGKTADKDSDFDGPPGQIITSAGAGARNFATIRTPIAVPTAAPVTPQPHLSVHEHKASSLNYSTPHNTFTTWLDFDDQDPPKRKSYPQPRDGQAFCDQWCDLRGGVTWYPDDKEKQQSWQRRAPAFLLPGALYSGTVYLAAALHQHPSILPARTKELQFFHERPFRRYVSPQEKTLVQAARERMYARDFNTTALAQNKQLVSFDASPGYFFYSSLLPRRILCVEPWVKLVLILRNPVDRVLEHYAAMQQRGLKLTLEAWIDKEFTLMEKVGLIQNATMDDDSNNKFFGSKEEDVAWYEYQTASVGGAIGRSMYVVQIRHWVQALRAVGRSPDQEILILRTDHVAVDPNVEYQRILRFLQLPGVPLHDSKSLPPLTVTHQTRPVAPATRERLEDFFRPYNRRLKRLLRQSGISSSAQDDNFP